MKIIKTLLLFSVVCFCSMAWSHDEKNTSDNAGFGSLVIFSGVFGDTGNFASLYGDLPPLFWNNRFANGPVVSDYFAENLGLSAEPSLHWNATEIPETAGYNYSTRDSWAASGYEHSLENMVGAYLERVDYSIPPDALIFMWSGGHDLIEAISTPGEIPYFMIDDAVSGIEMELYRLIDSGAQHIFAPSYADTSFSPAYIRRDITERVSEVTRDYNKKFRRMLNRVERRTGQRIYRFDFEEYVETLVSSHRYFGLYNVSEPCLEKAATGECDMDRFMFLSEILITSKTHQLIGDAFSSDLLKQVNSCKAGNWYPRAKPRVCGYSRHWHYSDDKGDDKDDDDDDYRDFNWGFFWR